MFIKKMEGKVVYHVSDSDLDGIGARCIAEQYLVPVVKNYIPYNTANRALPEFSFTIAKRSDIIIFTDITPPDLNFYNKLIKLNKKVYIFDHHQSGRDILGNLPDYDFDTTRCGAKIFYDTVVNGRRKNKTIEDFIKLVDTYDRFVQESLLWDKAKGLHNCLYGYVDWRRYNIQSDTDRYEYFIDANLKKFRKSDKYYFTKKEQDIISRAIKKEIKNYGIAKKTLRKRIDNDGNTYAYFECESKLSLVASRLMNDFLDIDYFIGYSTWKKGNLKVSVRSDNGFDTRLVSEKWGGGGHKPASGFEFLNEQKLRDFAQGKFHLI